MRKLTAASSALAAALTLGVAAPTVESASRTVRVKDDFFSPKTITVSRGTTVTWRWSGRKAHNVVVKSGPVKFQSRLQRSGSYRKKITRGGTYRIVCTIHSGMSMRLKAR